MGDYMRKTIVILIIISFLPGAVFSQTFGKRFSLEKQQEEQLSEEQQEMGLQSKQNQQTRILTQEVLLDRAINSELYKVGPGDGFSIVIETGEMLNYTVQVTPTGELLIPTVGVVDVNKKPLNEVIQEIERKIKNTYKNSQTNVALIKVRKLKIQVSGAVNKSGFYQVTPVTRLDEILRLCDGLHPFARDFAIKIKRNNGDSVVVNYLDFLRKGDLASNPTFVEGDRIIVPYGEVEKEGVMIRGAVERTGYDLIEKDETIEDYIRRGTNFKKNIELSRVFINRKGESLTVNPADFGGFTLQAEDKINFLSERGVAVNGFVQAPGGYEYIPGYTCSDYIGLAGGNTVQGDIDRVRVRHLNGKIEKGLSVEISPGDVIIVPRTRKNIFFGESSVLGIITSIASLYLTYIAATK